MIHRIPKPKRVRDVPTIRKLGEGVMARIESSRKNCEARAQKTQGRVSEYLCLMKGLISEGVEPIYIGSRVRQDVREAPENITESYNEIGFKGIVVGIEKAGEGRFSDTLVYKVKTEDGKEVESRFSDLMNIYPTENHYLLNRLLGFEEGEER